MNWRVWLGLWLVVSAFLWLSGHPHPFRIELLNLLNTQQERCYDAATRYHDTWDRQNNDPYSATAKITQDDYRSHFNTKIGKCLVRLDYTVTWPKEHSSSYTIELYDPNEKRKYAEWNSSNGMIGCFAESALGEKLMDIPNCPLDQFNALMNRYMTE